MISASFAGNLTGDPEGREAGSSYVARFTVAVDDGYRDSAGEWQKNPPLFVNVEVWRAVARGVVAQFEKGSPVVVTGRWRAAEYEKDGEKRRRQYVVADAVGAQAFVVLEATSEPRRGKTSVMQNITQDAADPAEPSEQGDESASEAAAETEGDGDFWKGAK